MTKDVLRSLPAWAKVTIPALVLVAASAGALASAGATAELPPGTIHGCVYMSRNHSLQRVYTNPRKETSCPRGTYQVVWDVQGRPGPAGPAGPEGPAQTESSRQCTPVLCIDNAPGASGNNGSGGWGWDASANGPVTSMKVGDTNPLVVTVLQPAAGEVANGSVTLTWNVDDFALASKPGDGTCLSGSSALPDVAGGYLTCSFTDLAHTAKSVPFSFTAKGANPAAVVSATVEVGGQTATAKFPIQITS